MVGLRVTVFREYFWTGLVILFLPCVRIGCVFGGGCGGCSCGAGGGNSGEAVELFGGGETVVGGGVGAKGAVGVGVEDEGGAVVVAGVAVAAGEW